MAGVLFFHHDNPKVLAQFPVQLPLSHIDGVHLNRAALQQAVSETASGRTEVSTNPTGYIDVKAFKGGFQLVATARYITRPLVYRKIRIIGKRIRGLCHNLPVGAYLASHYQPLGL
jgi:hypothetical protein